MSVAIDDAVTALTCSATPVERREALVELVRAAAAELARYGYDAKVSRVGWSWPVAEGAAWTCGKCGFRGFWQGGAHC